jgi:ketosteroid isomerase-like protein
MNTLELDAALNALIVAGKSVDAFERFYAEDVVAQENDEPERVGREPWMRARQEVEKKIKRFEARVLAHAADGDVSFSEWEYDMEIEGMGAMKMAQVAVRRWKNGRVVRERFYHK